MIGGPSVALWRDIHTLFDAGTVGGLTDRQLLERFTTARDGSSQAAFEVLVRRHGPMVLRVCRNVLKDWNDAEDAFQATFVVLARRCGSIRRRDSVESWLFGVACRVSARARVEAARRRAVERRGAAEADAALGTPEPDDADLPELGPIVQEEVRRLPEKYRAAVVLCYWEGLTQEQAAAQLGCPLGTVRSRIARARDLLRRRLSRRGVAPMAGIGATGFDVASVVPIPAAVPDSWVAATLKAVSPIAAGGAPATAVAASASVAVLVQYVLRRILIMKMKTIATGLLLIGLGAAGVILAAPQAGSNRTPPAPNQRPSTEAKPIQRAAPAVQGDTKKVQPAFQSMADYVIEPPDLILVEVLEALPGRPISGERLVRPDGKISLGFYGDIYVAGLTIPEVKEKVVLHLRKFISDETLGLVQSDPETQQPRRDKDGQVILSALKDTDRVFVDVSGYNSKNYYVQGAVRSPGRFHITGHENILDAINLADGLTPGADHNKVVLHRVGKDGVLQSLPIDIDQITMGDDPTTNYQIQPGDRFVIPSTRRASPDEDSSESKPAADPARSAQNEGARRAGRLAPAHDRLVNAGALPPAEGPLNRRAPHDLERRLGDVERKLDRILEALDRREGK
jgi:RNA polymerase sigma factor (sigma-70 family)